MLQDTASDPDPGQVAPPWAGAGFEQVLVLVEVPPPQVSEQDDQDVHRAQAPSTGQGDMVQEEDSEEDPEQVAPPYFGAGFEQERDLLLVPEEQVTEQDDQEDQVDHPPAGVSIVTVTH